MEDRRIINIRRIYKGKTLIGKYCTNCGEFKYKSCYTKKSEGRDKLKSKCKVCELIIRRKNREGGKRNER